MGRLVLISKEGLELQATFSQLFNCEAGGPLSCYPVALTLITIPIYTESDFQDALYIVKTGILSHHAAANK